MENKDVINILNSVDIKIQNLATSVTSQFNEIKTEIGSLKDKIEVSSKESQELKLSQANCMAKLTEGKVKWDEAYKDTTLLRMARKNPKVIFWAIGIIFYLGGPEWISKISQLIRSINF